MIHKKNIALVLDTNILIDILDVYESKDLKSLIEIWTCNIIKKIDPNIKGKTITIFVTTNIIKDYQAGLGKNQNKDFAKTIKFIFNKFISHKLPIQKSRKIYFTFKKFPDDKMPKKGRLKDKGDEKFLDLIEAILGNIKRGDWALIVASRDHATRDGIQDALKGKEIHFPDSLDDLEKIIEC